MVTNKAGFLAALLLISSVYSCKYRDNSPDTSLKTVSNSRSELKFYKEINFHIRQIVINDNVEFELADLIEGGQSNPAFLMLGRTTSDKGEVQIEQIVPNSLNYLMWQTMILEFCQIIGTSLANQERYFTYKTGKTLAMRPEFVTKMQEILAQPLNEQALKEFWLTVLKSQSPSADQDAMRLVTFIKQHQNHHTKAQLATAILVSLFMHPAFLLN